MAMIDRLVNFASFVVQHRRLPSPDRPLFNDVIYRLKNSQEIVDPLRVFVTDKEFVKTYVRDRVGESFNVPTLAILRRPGDVTMDRFPDDCVIKPTHASGYIITRRHGEPIDLERIRSWFSLDYYRTSRERNYQFLQPKVIVEPIVFGADDVMDYKIFCFNGSPRLIQVDYGRHTRHCRKFFDLDWQEQDFGLVYERGTARLERPANLDRMLAAASRLSRDFSLIRVDMYSDGESIQIGEMTNCPSGALGVFRPVNAEYEASRMVFGDVYAEALAAQLACS